MSTVDYEHERRMDKNYRCRVFYYVAIVVCVLLAAAMGIAALVVNQNMSSLQRFGVVATADETGSGSLGVMRGELSLQTAEERIVYRLQHRDLTSAITSLYIMGPLAPGSTHSATRALTLCGPPCTVACDTLSVANQVSGTLTGKCDDQTSLLGVITALRREPTRFYLQVNTGNFPGAADNGELRDFLVRQIGSGV